MMQRNAIFRARPPAVSVNVGYAEPDSLRELGDEGVGADGNSGSMRALNSSRSGTFEKRSTL